MSGEQEAPAAAEPSNAQPSETPATEASPSDEIQRKEVPPTEAGPPKPAPPETEEHKTETPSEQSPSTEKLKPPEEVTPEEDIPKKESRHQVEETKAEEASDVIQPEKKASDAKQLEKKASDVKQLEKKASKASRESQLGKTASKESRGSAKEEGKRSKTVVTISKDSLGAKSSELVRVEGPSVESLPKKTQSAIKDESRSSKLFGRGRRLSSPSRAQRVVGSIISIRRLSGTGEFYDRTKGARFMNTYKLDSDNPFKSEKVEKILESVMVEAMDNLTYDPDKCPKQAKWASGAIRTKVKDLQFDRYKLICIVSIGEKTSQDVLVTCRFLWDAKRDSYATYCIENTYVYGIAQCFGLYYE